MIFAQRYEKIGMEGVGWHSFRPPTEAHLDEFEMAYRCPASG
jgi:hypothetical protein